uniref:Uncharacterized protein n=1 Tax=Rhizophora mucronata TaxID=61149 RepID=A0A2P2Q3A3_RHIMU
MILLLKSICGSSTLYPNPMLHSHHPHPRTVLLPTDIEPRSIASDPQCPSLEAIGTQSTRQTLLAT